MADHQTVTVKSDQDVGDIDDARCVLGASMMFNPALHGEYMRNTGGMCAMRHSAEMTTAGRTQ